MAQHRSPAIILNARTKSGSVIIQSKNGEVVTKSITFDEPFDHMPAVVLGVKTGMPEKRLAAANLINKSGFIINLYDMSEEGEVAVDWIAYEI